MKRIGQAAAAAAVLLMAVSPALAAPVQPAAAKLSIAKSARAGAQTKDSNKLFGVSGIVVVLILAAIAVGVYFIVDDDNPASA